MKQLISLVYKVTGELMKSQGDGPTITTELSYYPILQEIGTLYLQYRGIPNSKMQKQMNLLTPLLKQLSGDTKPMYLTPKELVQKLPSLTLSQLSSEILWLSTL